MSTRVYLEVIGPKANKLFEANNAPVLAPTEPKKKTDLTYQFDRTTISVILGSEFGGCQSSVPISRKWGTKSVIFLPAKLMGK